MASRCTPPRTFAACDKGTHPAPQGEIGTWLSLTRWSGQPGQVSTALHSHLDGELTGTERVGIVLVEAKMVASELARRFGVLSVESRVQILQRLSEQSLCVGALSRRLGLSAGAVSQHLRILREAGLVLSERRGYYLHYRVNSDIFSSWVVGLMGWLRSFRAEAAGVPLQAEQQPFAAGKKSTQPWRARGKPQVCSTGNMKECGGNKRNHCCGQGRRGER